MLGWSEADASPSTYVARDTRIVPIDVFRTTRTVLKMHCSLAFFNVSLFCHKE